MTELIKQLVLTVEPETTEVKPTQKFRVATTIRNTGAAPITVCRDAEVSLRLVFPNGATRILIWHGRTTDVKCSHVLSLAPAEGLEAVQEVGIPPVPSGPVTLAAWVPISRAPDCMAKVNPSQVLSSEARLLVNAGSPN